MGEERIVITGANGFVGSAMLEYYANHENEVLAVDIMSEEAYPSYIRDAVNIKILTCDINSSGFH